MKTDREKALKWWYKIGFNGSYHQRNLGRKYYPDGFTDFDSNVEEIWRKETHNPSATLDDEILDHPKYKKSQVDFEMLIALEELVETFKKKYKPLSPLFDNYSNFIELLSKSSSFAHKAHKELKRLNK